MICYCSVVQFWQLILLRVGVALGEAVCRPAASSLIAEIFSPASREVQYCDALCSTVVQGRG